MSLLNTFSHNPTKKGVLYTLNYGNLMECVLHQNY